ncbi:MAG: DNA repair protein RadC [Gammaproteobacteria bacterium]|jgi:DNA repair protein RadC
MIKSWPKNERPREKLLKHGAEYLTDAELLAIFLRTGVKGKTAVDLGRDLLLEFGSLKQLFDADLTKFCQQRGLGIVKYVQLQAVLELSRRYLCEKAQSHPMLSCSKDTKEYLLAKLSHLKREIFMGIFLDGKHRVIDFQELFKGSIDYVNIYPRELIAMVLDLHATSIIVVHNHPSGDPKPSHEDIQLTKFLQNALSFIEVKLLDHLIVGTSSVVSLKELGLW